MRFIDIVVYFMLKNIIAMPGNKNSGRKKKIVNEEQPPDTPVIKKKPGRPKKEVKLKSSDETRTAQEQIEQHDDSASCSSFSSQVLHQKERMFAGI